MKYYICGPMTGVPQFNVPLFDEVSAKLRADGFEVVSPAELDSPEMRAAALASQSGDMNDLAAKTGETWGDVLARDVKIISDTLDAIVVLPGWNRSRGARLEVFVGLLTGKQFFVYRPHGKPGYWLLDAPRDHIQQVVRDNMP